ncbi:MAG: transketolase, partial [Candidatus Magasanikbacteria bacterium CG10_big_fil_rev_8_21_14_0_10_38_6]
MTKINLSQNLSKEQLAFLKTFSKSCRHSIIAMLKQSQSGHPGGSLGCVDYLSLLYTQILSQTGEKIIISNGHISPAVYAVLAEMGYINKQDVINGFRKIGYPYEGHVTRHVPGVWYGTGPLGTGISAASGFALAEKLKKSKEKVFALVGDGESQEGQVYEMMNFSHKYKLNNFIVFMDYNQVQLTDSTANIMPIDFKAIFKAGGWNVIEVQGHDSQSMWKGLREAYTTKDQPVLLLGHTIMGKGVSFMEEAGKAHKADWHGKAPKPEQADEALVQLTISEKERTLLNEFVKKQVKWKPPTVQFEKALSPIKINTGKPKLYEPDILTDCRSAYGNALLDLAKKNK